MAEKHTPIDFRFTRFELRAGTADITPTLAYVSPARTFELLAGLPFVLGNHDTTPPDADSEQE